MKQPPINFSKLNGLVPCIAQDATTNKVLMLGFMNKEAYEKSMKENRLTFYSRTKERLWTKGEKSGNYLTVVDILVDCDNDTLLAKVNPHGPACHTGNDTCFDEHNKHDWSIYTLEKVIVDRKNNPTENSYTSKLLKSGINKVAQKVGEEAVELVIESKDDNKELFVNEAADLMYHFLVLLAAKDTSLSDVEKILSKRHSK